MKVFQVIVTSGSYSDYTEFTLGVTDSMAKAKLIADRFKNEPNEVIDDNVVCYGIASIVIREYELDRYYIESSEAKRQCNPVDSNCEVTLYDFEKNDDWENPMYVFKEAE